MDRFEVGDRVQGKISGKIGTITEALGNDQYKGVIDDAEPGVSWTAVRGENLRLLPKPIEVVKTPRLKVGDTVKHQGSNSGTVYDVWGVHGIHLWLHERGTGGFGYIGIAAVYEKVLPFFVASKVYRRQTEWSIFFQKSSAIEHFEVARVDFNKHGKPVAYGRLFLPGLESKYGWRWVTKDQHSFDMEGWEQI